MGLHLKGGDKNSLALLSSKRTRAYSRTRADEAFALPSFSDAMPVAPMEPWQQHLGRLQIHAEHNIGGRAKSRLEEEMTAQAEHCQEYGSVPASEKHDTMAPGTVDGTQNVRQTMLKHESMFKEQLHELHRIYQKQCLLMAEKEQKGRGCQQLSEPPSSTKSALPRTSTCWAEEERSLGDTSTAEVARSSKQDHCALSNQVGIARPHGIDSKSQEQQEGHPVLGLENSAAASCRPILDLELPAEEYMYFEEKTRVVDGTYRAADTSAACMPENRSANPKLSICSYPDIRAANCSSNAKVFDKQRGHIDVFNDHHQEAKEIPLTWSRAAEYMWKEPRSGPIAADKPPLFMLRETEAIHGGKVSIHVGAQDRKCLALPEWFSQAPQKSVDQAVPYDIYSDRQQKGKRFFPMRHDQRIPSNLESPKSPAIKELLHPLLQSGLSSQQGNIPSWIVSRAISGTPHKMAPDNAFKSASLPFLHSHVWVDQDTKAQTSRASGYLTSDVRETQKTELFARHSTRASSTTSILPWFGQRDCPLQELKQEPSLDKPAGVSYATGGHELRSSETATGHMLPSSNALEIGFYRMHKFDAKGMDTHGCLPPPTRPESPWKRSVIDFAPTANPEIGITPGLRRRENDTAREEVAETFLCPGQVSRANSERCHLPDLNSRLVDFDLNESVSPGLEEEDDLHGFSSEQNGRHLNAEALRQEHATTESSLGWRCMEAHHVFEQFPTDGEFTEAVYKITCCTETATKIGFLCSQAGMHVDSRCTSVEDETGEQLVVGKSSDGSGLTTSENRDATKARVSLKTSSGEACQSRESWNLGQKDDIALSSNSQCRRSISVALLDDKVLGVDCRSQQSVVENPSGNVDHEPKRMHFADGGTEYGDENEVANSTFGDMAEAAELLLSLGTDLPLFDVKGKDHKGPLEWFVDIIPQEGSLQAGDITGGAMGAGTALCRGLNADQYALEGAREKIIDPFESAVLMLKPVNPDSEFMSTKDGSMVGGMVGMDLSPAQLRRRLSRRGRFKDFNKRGALQSLSSLSRQEITEDLEIMEGMIKSCGVRKQSSKVFKEVCSSWCESARRRKQRGCRRWLSLPFLAV